MSRYSFIALTVLLITCSSAVSNRSHMRYSDENIPEIIDISHIIEFENIDPKTTSLLVIRLSDKKKWVSNSERLNQRFSPASTSKIPHTLIALETEEAKANTVYKWDGRPRTFKGWNQDQTLMSAYKRSAVWVYQEITASLGTDVMSKWLRLFDYGNQDIGGVETLTTYWLSEPLKISASEQVDFLTKLSQENLPLSEKTFKAAKNIFKAEQSDTSTLYAKTGWMYDENKTDIGWYVGWVDDSSTQDTYVFAFNMDMEDGSLRHKRKDVVMNALIFIGAWPEK